MIRFSAVRLIRCCVTDCRMCSVSEGGWIKGVRELWTACRGKDDGSGGIEVNILINSSY